MARPGVGKTAILVQIGLDEALRGRDVLHIALGQSLTQAQSWYDSLFNDWVTGMSAGHKETARTTVARHRILQCFPDHDLSPGRLSEVVARFAKHANFSPTVLLIDGFSWDGPTAAVVAAIRDFRAHAKVLQAEIWMTAQAERAEPEPAVWPKTPCAACAELIDVVLLLTPHGAEASIRLIKDHDNPAVPDTHLLLESDTLRVISALDRANTRHPLPGAYSLLSGGAPGAESAFGECAERWGVHETNYTYAGRAPARTRGVVELSPQELREGEVSATYLQSHWRRSLPATREVRQLLQSIWHQVVTAGEVFVVGRILEDQTVKGGTGWAVELARHFQKPVYVFDQEKNGWFCWQDGEWTAAPAPRITRRRFAGTGTQSLTEQGRTAIEKLFGDSFGAAA